MKEFLFFSDVHGDVCRDDVFFNEAEQRLYMILSKGLLSDLVDVSISTPGENPVFSAVGKNFIDNCKRQMMNIVLSYGVKHPRTNEHYNFSDMRRKIQSNEKSKRAESLTEIATHVAHADIRAEDVFDKSAREDVKVYLHRDSHIPRTIIAETEGYVILKDDRNGREMCMNRRKFEEKYFEAEKHVMSKFFIVRMNSVSGPIDTKKEALEIFKIAKTEKDRAIAIREIDFTTYREVEKK